MNAEVVQELGNAGPVEVLDALLHRPEQTVLIDVRSPGEWQQCAIPGSVNAPILTDAERHAVGLCYKNAGQQAAIDLGLALTASESATRTKRWQELASMRRNVFVTCWRGGLRSQYAQNWLAAQGRSTRRVHGGYKALRAVLLAELHRKREFFVLSGKTGSGKTALLRSLKNHTVDLELCAHHRGSAFGAFLGLAQPSQATFENRLCLSLMATADPIVIEDESALIGRVRIPQEFHQRMRSAPAVILQATFEERVANIFADYVIDPLAAGGSPSQLAVAYCGSVERLAKSLGDALARTLKHEITAAFVTGDRSMHLAWIATLLDGYYDQRYEYSFQRYERNVLFAGNAEAVRKFLQNSCDSSI